ncbi:hypothetical protein Nepgr_022975 [Nepenthes gracilis]|uniref:Uncharacterized protein n=1 Tax=Nepenthes gracilis TaxID=150966 RepID=A0AAD3XXH3_NEPGR|nr:hypothetical protein Nepgr_022975 [Nepenthes gracilis]
MHPVTICSGALMEQIRCSWWLGEDPSKADFGFWRMAMAGALLALVYEGFFDVVLVLCWVMAPEFIPAVFSLLDRATPGDDLCILFLVLALRGVEDAHALLIGCEGDLEGTWLNISLLRFGLVLPV